MRIRNSLWKCFAALPFAFCCALSLRADVWSDCQACYRGGFDDNDDGRWFEGSAKKYGEFIDVLHAADKTDWRHYCQNEGCTDQYLYYHLETVTSACANVVFPERKILRIDPTRGRPDQGTENPDPARCIHSGVRLGYDATAGNYLITNEQWSALYRFRIDAERPSTSSRIYLVDMGYNGSNGFLINFSNLNGDADNQLYLTCRGYDGNKGTGLYMTNSIVAKKTEVWTELAIVADGRTVKLGLFLPGCSAQWKTLSNIGETSAMPGNKNQIRLGYYYDRDGTYFKGAFDMAAFWNRKLSDGEVIEAFSCGHPAILKVGAEGRGNGMFAGGDASANVNALAADLRSVPATFATGTQLTIDYDVPVVQTNLAQVLRVAVSQGGATFLASIDGEDIGEIETSVKKPGLLFVPARKFTAGAHALTLVCSAGSGAVLGCIELAGSWRLGLEDGLHTGFGSYGVGTGWQETTAEKAGQKDFYLGLRDNVINVRFGEANPGVSFEPEHTTWPANRYQNLHFTLTPEMAERGRYEFAYRLTDASIDYATADWPPEIEVVVNGVSRQVERLFQPGRLHVLTLSKDWLRSGENTITTRFAHNLESTGRTGHEIRYDYYKLSLTRLSHDSGCLLIVR